MVIFGEEEGAKELIVLQKYGLGTEIFPVKFFNILRVCKLKFEPNLSWGAEFS